MVLPWRTKSESDTVTPLMAARTCRVTVTDLEKVSHTVEVTATTLYEAIALALVTLRESDWVARIPEGLAAVRVSVTQIPIEHIVKMRDFTNWVEREGGSPRKVSSRDPIRARNSKLMLEDCAKNHPCRYGRVLCFRRAA